MLGDNVEALVYVGAFSPDDGERVVQPTTLSPEASGGHRRGRTSDDDRARVHLVSRARRVQAEGAAALPLASISRSDGTLGFLFEEPQRRFEARLREGEIEVRLP